MSTLESRLARLLDALEFAPDGGARFRGEPCTVDEPSDLASDPKGADADWSAAARGAREWLADHLYAEWHCGIPQFVLRRPHIVDGVATRDFLRTLSRANATDRTWEAGWAVAGVEQGGVVTAERRGVRFVVSPDAVRAGTPAPGEPCLVQVEGEQRNLLPGFYLALGEYTPDVAPEDQVRVYWHIRSGGGALLLSTLSRSLNTARLPFWLKLLNDPASYHRTDAAVLYLPRDVAADAAPLILDAHAAVRGHLRTETSPFALRMAPGLAVAPDLPRSASFGRQRSVSLATAIVTAALEDTQTARRLTSGRVLDAWRAQGIDPIAPFRHTGDPNTEYWTAWQLHAREPDVHAHDAEPASSEPDHSARALDIAAEIGDWTCREALVHDGMWSWIGSDVTIDDDSSELAMSYRAFGPALYDGTAGMALFLGEAFALTGRSRLADGARGAIRHAFRRSDDLPADTRRGFHTGMAGMAWVAARLGHLLSDDVFVRHARRLALELARDPSPPPLLDVISGAAGTAVAFLTLAEDLELDELRDAASRLGASICAGATRSEAGWSWGANASGAEFARDLAGFAHGAGGIGWALLELGTALGVDAFVAGAREAIRYEDRWFVPDEGNWPDFRESDGVESPAPSMMAWCHGAPGIILSRLRAVELLGDPQARVDLVHGLRGAAGWLSDPDVAAESSYTLCHGQLGVAECVRRAADALDDEPARRAALAPALRGMAAHSGDPESWLPGLRRGRNPSLMLGQAGIGHFYLRMVSPAVPSVLLWGQRSRR